MDALDTTTAEQYSLSLAPAEDFLARLLSVFALGLLRLGGILS